MDIQRNVKNKSETADTERVGFLHSLKAKILLLVAAAVVLTVVLNLWTVIPKSSSNISELTSNYMLDVAMVAGEGIDNQIRMSSYDSVMSGGNLSRVIGNIEIKGVKDSYKTNNVVSIYKEKVYNSIELDLEKRLIKLPKLKWVKIKGYRNKESINGRIRSAVIRKVATRYYVSILVEEDVYKPMFTPQSIIGIDLGIKDLIVTSHNEKIKNIIKDRSKRLKGLQRALARCKAGSKNRYKIKLKIQRLWQKIRNARKHLIHDITNKLIKEHDIIVCENLDVKSMYKDHNIAKSLSSNPLGEIIRVLKYKAEWNNKKLIQIDRYYPSSQVCSVCEFQNKELKNLSIRNYECPMCHTKHDRDFNTSVNIMFEGLKIYMQS